jgi:hypothetical protein
LLLSVGWAFPTMAQSRRERITVDPWLTLTFPGMVTQLDTLGSTLIQTTVDQTTYQAVKRGSVLDRENEPRQPELLDEAAKQMMSNSKFSSMSKHVSDSVIGGTRGRFIQMDNSATANPYHVFCFMAFQRTDMYMLQCTSFKPLSACLNDVRYFYSQVVFGVRPVPIK